MNDQPPAGEKNPKYPLSRVENAYFSTDYLIFVLIPVVLPPSCLPTHPKIFPGLRPARFLIPVFSLIPDPYSRFFPDPPPHPLLLSGLGKFCGFGNKNKIRTYDYNVKKKLILIINFLLSVLVWW